MAKTILVSAGHTNDPRSDRGAAGNGYVEGDEAVKIRDDVARILREEKKLSVIEDGSDGVNDPLKKAVALARAAEIAVEIHFNSAASPSASGTEVLSKPKHRKLAQSIAKSISANLGIPARGGDVGWKADNSGQHHRLAFCEAGGIIVEICFISNKSDMDKYKSNYRLMCLGIANAISGFVVEKAVDVESDYYTVKAGDTIWSIARRFLVAEADIKQWNGLTSDKIGVGQRLRLKTDPAF